MSYTIRRFNKIGDDEIIKLFCQMDNEGIKSAVFYDGEIVTPWDFIEFIRSGLTWGGFIFKGDEPVACMWVTGISANAAFFHYWTYKISWGHTQEVAMVALKYIAANTHLTSLCGRTPSHLTLAIRTLKRSGFEILGTIPEAIKLLDGSIVDAVVSYYDLRSFKEA